MKYANYQRIFLGSLCVEHGVSKYPTLRLFKFGKRCRSEYRNQRSVDAFISYLREETANPIKILNATVCSTLR